MYLLLSTIRDVAVILTSEKELPSEWPSKGNIQFNQMSLRYSKDEETILKNISCLIRDKEKVQDYYTQLISLLIE